MSKKTVAIVGSGPAGLIAAELLARAGHRVTVFERLPSPARKLLMAGRGGLNLTHSEPLDRFLSRYTGEPRAVLQAIEAFPPVALLAWAAGLGVETFSGTSGRIFPKEHKASPLLRALLRRLTDLGVSIETRQLWTGWDGTGRLTFMLADGTSRTVAADAVLLALGGASWSRLGTDGSWVSALEQAGVQVTPLTAANAGVLVPWSSHIVPRFAGEPLKRIAIAVDGRLQRGEAVITAAGLEGGAVYAVVPAVRRALAEAGHATVTIDLRPDESEIGLVRRLSAPRGKDSLSTYLRKRLALSPLAIALMRESAEGALPQDAHGLARLVKSVPVLVTGMAGLARAISTAGGIALDAIDEDFMLKARPGVFAAGEMLDWEAPTGGYLLQACFATGVAAAKGMARYLEAADGGRGADDGQVGDGQAVVGAVTG